MKLREPDTLGERLVGRRAPFCFQLVGDAESPRRRVKARVNNEAGLVPSQPSRFEKPAMSVISDISDLIIQVYKLWKEGTAEGVVSPQELYVKYVAPSYALLREVHNDYLNIYVELEERITMEEELSASTVDWFTRARLTRQVDRSELHLLDLPSSVATKERTLDIREAAASYIASTRAYFEPPSLKNDFSTERLRRLGPTGATLTELRLRVMRAWQGFTLTDQRMIATEEYLESTASMSQDEIIQKMLAAGIGFMEIDVAQHLEKLHEEADAAFNQARLELSAAPPEKQRQVARRQREGSFVYGFEWKNVLQQHIWRQRWHFEEAMKAVQMAYIRLRILTDR